MIVLYIFLFSVSVLIDVWSVYMTIQNVWLSSMGTDHIWLGVLFLFLIPTSIYGLVKEGIKAQSA